MSVRRSPGWNDRLSAVNVRSGRHVLSAGCAASAPESQKENIVNKNLRIA
jgi:hypothetical protein